MGRLPDVVNLGESEMESLQSDQDIRGIISHNIQQLERNPADIDTCCDTAELLVQLDRVDTAIEVVNNCLTINRGDPWLRFRLAGLYLSKGLQSEVSKIVEQFKAENIDTPALRKLRIELQKMRRRESMLRLV